MEKGSIVITVLPQADGISKDRPFLILGRVAPFDDILVTESDPDFPMTHLTTSFVIRKLYLATLPNRQIKGKLGYVSLERLRRVYKTLENHFSDLGRKQGR